MIDFKELSREVRLIALDARVLSALIERDVFLKAWGFASEQEKEEVVQLLRLVKRAEVEDWLKRVVERDIAELPVRLLRAKARAAGIDYYSSKSKSQLIAELKKEA